MEKKFIIPAANWLKILGISPNYQVNLLLLFKDIAASKIVLKLKENEINKTKALVKAAIAKNDKEYSTYKKTIRLPEGSPQRENNKEIKKLISVPDLNVKEFFGSDTIDCGLQVRTFIHRTANHSPLKQNYCKYVYRNFRKVRIKELRFYTKLAKKEMLSILAMKKSLYCGVCDATLQNNFDDKHKLILYSQRFCHDLISQYSDYIRFRHIILIEFYDQFFQLISCYEFKNELGVDFPYRTMLESRKRRIKTIRTCLDNLNTPDFYKYCYYVCSQFNLTKFSPFFDGDLELLKTLYAKFTMFFRRYSVYRKNLNKSKRKGKKKRKRKRNLNLKRQKSMKEVLSSSYVETQNGLNSDNLIEKESNSLINNDYKSEIKKKFKKKVKKKLSREGRKKMRSLKKHFAKVNSSLTDEISLLVMNHKDNTNKKRKELSDRKKYIEKYHNEMIGKKILSKKHIEKNKTKENKIKEVKEQKETIQVDQTKNDEDTSIPGKVEMDKGLPKNNQGLWGRKRILSSDISMTFSNELQNSFFEKRLEEENKREAELTQTLRLSSQERDSKDRDLKVKLTKMEKHGDNPSEEVNKKFKKPRRKMTFSYEGKKKKTQAQKIRAKISYLRLHSEGTRLPTYFNYSINPNLRKTYTESIYSKSIYHKTHLPYEIKSFRPFFVKSIHGFNPLRTTEMMRLDFDPRQIIALTRKKNYKPEKLTGKVVKTYLSFHREEMAGFHHDVDLDFDEYGHTERKSYADRTEWPKYKFVKKEDKKPFVRDDSNPFKPITKWEFHNPDMRDMHAHFRPTTTNHPHGTLWNKIFGR